MPKNYLYQDRHTGEYFYVNTNSRKEADEIANDNFKSPKYIGIESDYIADMSGYDTY